MRNSRNKIRGFLIAAILFRQFLIYFHQFRYDFWLRIDPAPEAVGLHDSLVILLFGYS